MQRDDEKHPEVAAERDSQRPPNRPSLFLFEVLASGGKEILIDFNSQIYRLRVTKNGKLILNK